ncbi:hypothetical protein [Deinococcus proteolyticus]|nr:hypothetical protein [Deinococcus proteolyticus]
MRRLLLPSLLALLPLLSGCMFTVPPRDNAQWTTTTHGVTVHWRLVTPGSLGGLTSSLGHRPGDLTTPRYAGTALVQVAAHEFGHCAAGRYIKVSPNTQGLDTYNSQLFERYAEHYAQLYLRECGDSLRPLGWYDLSAPTCREAPDPRRLQL